MNSENKYTNYSNSGAFSGISGFFKNNKNLKKGVKKKILKNDVYTLHKPVRKKFKRCKAFVQTIDEHWQCDLIDVQKIRGHNNNYGFINPCIDSFSKYGWAVPIKKNSSKL
jgi:hypothetical protein